MGWRLAAAFVLRLVVAVCIALGVAGILLVALAVLHMLAGDDGLRGSGTALLAGAMIAVVLLALARFAHMAVGLFVDRSPRDQ
jgi:hypothetical protein